VAVLYLYLLSRCAFGVSRGGLGVLAGSSQLHSTFRYGALIMQATGVVLAVSHLMMSKGCLKKRGCASSRVLFWSILLLAGWSRF
jgi:hypothetical protein